MATYYARNVTGNWATTSSWDSVSSGGAGPAGPPIAGDTAIFDSAFTGSITVAAGMACATLTTQAGATGTLTVSFGCTISGNITLVSGFNTAVGTANGIFTMTGAGAILTGGIASCAVPIGLSSTVDTTITGATNWAEIRVGGGTKTITLGSALDVTLMSFSGFGSATIAGAFNITCVSLLVNSPTAVLALVAGQSLTVSTNLTIHPGTETSLTSTAAVQSATASSSTSLVFNGTAANCKVYKYIFTDIAYSGATVTNLDNWYGGTLTRTSGITNRTSADIGAGTSRLLIHGGMDGGMRG